MARSVFAIIHDLTKGLDDLKASLAPLAHLAGSGAPPTGRTRRPGTKKSVTRRRTRKPVSRALQAARRLQGKYLAAVRGLTKAQRARVKGARAKGSVQSAIKLAKSLAK